MEYFLNDREMELKMKAREVAEKLVLPVRDKFDETAEFPMELVKEMGKQGLLKIFIPEEYGGTGARIIDMCIAVEEIARVCAGIATAYAVGALGSGPIVLFASEEQKKKYLPGIATGELLCAFGLTEAQAGSDAANIQTTARKEGDYYILNGVKQFISNASFSDVYTVLASTDKSRGARGISAFIVEKDFPGFSYGKKENKLGIRASVTTELVFEDCRVPKENLMGKEGLGFIYTMRNFDRARPGVGAIALGIAQGAYEEVLDFAYEHNLLNNQYVQKKIADMATEIEAGRSLLYATARMIDAGIKGYSKESSFAKLYPSDLAVKTTIEAIKLMGPYGVMKEYHMEKRLRDAKITQIYEGTNEIQRSVIALELTRETGKKAREKEAK
ncbi:MAG TPA: acyl-CoA dehydrogenase [candidate division WOR-3 bacterium]|uniref:Acyl-CoA dehydrogenase n=1 Tax=candidate division WOR-3 bacterium TaxID=2052148 RepID=A0A9C9EM91_UNCW3|nr:acyl-CoA dehydrogenase [candidate division WOR-3 bacterium]